MHLERYHSIDVKEHFVQEPQPQKDDQVDMDTVKCNITARPADWRQFRLFHPHVLHTIASVEWPAC